jgi:hypothetical protein
LSKVNPSDIKTYKDEVYIWENINTQALIDVNATNSPFLLIIALLSITGASQIWINPIAVI